MLTGVKAASCLDHGALFHNGLVRPQREPSRGCGGVADQPEANRSGGGSQADAKRGQRGCLHSARTDQPAQERGGAESKRQMPAAGDRELRGPAEHGRRLIGAPQSGSETWTTTAEEAAAAAAA